MNKYNSPYSAITGGGLLYGEFLRILPLLMDENSDRLLKEEIANNNLMLVNSESSRKRFMAEFRRRFNAVPKSFWTEFISMSEEGQRVGLFYVILCTYKLVFDFHFNVTIKCWNSIEQTVTKGDLMMEFNYLSLRDPFVDTWSEGTKERCISQYLTILKQVGLLDASTNELRPAHISPSDFNYYIQSGEEWFLEACLLYPYEINEIKSLL